MPAAIPLAAAAIGAGPSIYSANKAAKAGGQQGSGGTVQQTNAPWSGLTPYLSGTQDTPWGPAQTGNTALYPEAERLYRQGAYQGPYLTDQSPYSTQAIQGLADQARDPKSLTARAQGELGRTIGGQYLDVGSNPYLSGAVQTALDQVKRNVSGQFTGENFSSSANQEWLGRHLANTALPIYSNAYQTERQNQLNALGLAPGLQQANLQQLAGAGAAQELRGQQEIGAAQQQFYAPWDVLSRYGQTLGTINTPNSGTTVATQPSYYDPLGAGLGGALGGAQLGSNLQGLFGGGYPQSQMSGFPTSGGDPGGYFDPGYGY